MEDILETHVFVIDIGFYELLISRQRLTDSNPGPLCDGPAQEQVIVRHLGVHLLSFTGKARLESNVVLPIQGIIKKNSRMGGFHYFS